MTTFAVGDSVQLAAALANASAGDVIQLAGGSYGDLEVRGLTFDRPIQIVAADPDAPPTFSSIYVYKSSGVHFSGVNVDFEPDHDTLAFSSAVKIRLSDDVSFTNGEIKGGPSVNGVPFDADQGDETGNVLGLPAGRGVTIDSSTGVTLEGMEIHQFHKGLVLANSSGLVIRNNEIHDLRTSSITGGGVNDVVIEGNFLHDSNPWRWGSGDHGDFIHLWTAEKVGTSHNIRITNNVIAQGDGIALLGIYLDDNGRGIGFVNVEISNNLIMNGDHQGIGLENVSNARVTDNVLLQSSGTHREAPGMLFTQGTHDMVVSGNFAKFITPNETTYDVEVVDNTLIQMDREFEPGFYTAEAVQVAAGLSPASAHELLTAVVEAWKPLDVATRELTLGVYDIVDTNADLKVSAKGPFDQVVVGGRGNDVITGLHGHDTLVGGPGDDTLNGSRGHDVLQGGSGADTFNFSQRYPTEGGFDTILDFRRDEGDLIRLHSIDASTRTPGNDAFAFIGLAPFSGAAGQLRYEVRNGDSFVTGDVDGDGVADFEIRVVGVGSLAATDFGL